MKPIACLPPLLLLLALATNAAEPTKPAAISSEHKARSAPQKSEAISGEGRKLGQFVTRHGFRRLYVLLPAGLDDAGIIALAQQWHQREPDAWLWLLDDDSQFPKLLETLPKTEQGELADFPAEWIKQHAVANLALVLYPDRSRRWVLYRGAWKNEEMAELPCIDGKGQCKP